MLDKERIEKLEISKANLDNAYDAIHGLLEDKIITGVSIDLRLASVSSDEFSHIILNSTETPYMKERILQAIASEFTDISRIYSDEIERLKGEE